MVSDDNPPLTPPMPLTSPVPNSPHLFHVMDLLQHRFSFRDPNPSHYQRDAAKSTIDYDWVLKTIGYNNGRASVYKEQPFHIPVQHLASVKQLIDDVLLDQQSHFSELPRNVSHLTPVTVQIHEVQHYIPKVWVAGVPGNYVQPERTEEFTLYQLVVAFSDPTAVREPWILSVRSALTVLHVMREDFGADVATIVKTMVRHGIPFELLVPKFPTSPPHLAPTTLHTLSSIRREPFKMTYLDYLDYTTARDTFLRGPRGHLALRFGGLVWRLALDVVDTSKLYDELEEYDFKYDRDDGCGWFGGERLTVQEIEIIVGSYHLFSEGKLLALLRPHLSYRLGVDGRGYTSLSWWPKPVSWSGSALDIGCWSIRAEAWYQDRLQEIREKDGHKMLVRHRDWDLKLKVWHKTAKFINKSEKAAAEYLSTQF